MGWPTRFPSPSARGTCAAFRAAIPSPKCGFVQPCTARAFGSRSMGQKTAGCRASPISFCDHICSWMFLAPAQQLPRREETRIKLFLLGSKTGPQRGARSAKPRAAARGGVESCRSLGMRSGGRDQGRMPGGHDNRAS